jgi:hypothetical protein
MYQFVQFIFQIDYFELVIRLIELNDFNAAKFHILSKELKR